ncbi:MAG: hypothetical protein PHQ58_07030 [Rhodoferax sp.]|uniref:hypothetical protein n=1 Tax=Rhodoferax sp. TaxID=50421 RepID=UPI002609C869|nr:hypothetical protein [Rhodoferax sp.]MDD2880174.1 hypothetical protein [Rhodoferax sp.]
MQFKQCHHKRRVILAFSLLGVFGLGMPVAADPVTHQDATPATAEAASPGELTWTPAALTIEGMASQNRSLQTPSITPQERPAADQRTPNQTAPPRLGPADATSPPLNTPTDPDLAAEIHNTLKETARPLHDQILDSGAMEVWNDVKRDMGLGRTQEDDEGASSTRPQRMSGQWEGGHLPAGQDPDNRPKTAAQTEMDRELASHMMERLIDEIKPWALSALGLYLLGYLIKIGIDYSRRRSIRRRERRAARARRRSARKASSTNREV